MSRLIALSGYVVVLALVGCQAAPPVPSERYFRLEVAPGDAPARTILSETLHIAPLRAEGPYAERAMLHAPANRPRELQQYHYQLWSEPPALLLQEHMRASFEAMAFAPRVTDIESASGAGYLLNAKVLRLEKITGNGAARAMISLRIALQRKKPFALLLERSYSAEEVVHDNTQHGYVIASEAGLKKIYARFAEDVKSLP